MCGSYFPLTPWAASIPRRGGPRWPLLAHRHASHPIAGDLEGEVAGPVEPVAAHRRGDRRLVAGPPHVLNLQGDLFADELVVAPPTDALRPAELTPPVVDHAVGGETGQERVGVLRLG